MALALKPRLLLLDEPTAGMGDQETYNTTQLIRRLHRDQSLTVVLIEHDMRVIFHLADRITVLAEGAVLAEGTPPEIAANATDPRRPVGVVPLFGSHCGALRTRRQAIDAWSIEFGKEQPDAIEAENGRKEQGQDPEGTVQRWIHRCAQRCKLRSNEGYLVTLQHQTC